MPTKQHYAGRFRRIGGCCCGARKQIKESVWDWTAGGHSIPNTGKFQNAISKLQNIEGALPGEDSRRRSCFPEKETFRSVKTSWRERAYLGKEMISE